MIKKFRIITVLVTLLTLIILIPSCFAGDLIYIEPDPFEVSLSPGESTVKEFVIHNKKNNTEWVGLRIVNLACACASGMFFTDGNTTLSKSVEIPANGSSAFDIRITGDSMNPLGETSYFILEVTGSDFTGEIHMQVYTGPNFVCLSPFILIITFIVMVAIYFKSKQKKEKNN